MLPTSPTPTRISPIPADKLDVIQSAVVRDITLSGSSLPNVIRTFVRHPELCRAWLAVGTTLSSQGHLSDRDRELVILRVAAKTNCGYEWAQHSSARAQAASLTDDLTRLTVDSLSGWTGWDATVLSAVDQICEHRYISDATWRTLSESYTDKQLIEFTFLCAQYVALATVLNTLGVPIDGE